MVTVEVEHAGDPLAEAVRRSICDGEIEQIIGRARGVNRTEANPVEVHVLSAVPFTDSANHLVEWSPPSKDDELFAQSGVWLSSDGDMAQAHGVSRNTLRMARQRMSTVSSKDFYYENVPNLCQAEYKRAGPGRSMQRVVYDPSTVPDIEVFLRARLGELVAFAEVQPSPEVDLLPVADRVCQTGRATRRTQQSFAGEICISSPLLNNHLQDRYGLGGRGAEAFEWIEKARRLSPRDMFREEFDLHDSFAHFQVGNYEQGAEFAAKASVPRPEHLFPHLVIATCHGQLGNDELAQQEIIKIQKIVPDFSLATAAKVDIFTVSFGNYDRFTPKSGRNWRVPLTTGNSQNLPFRKR